MKLLLTVRCSLVVPMNVQALFFPDLETIESDYHTRLLGGEKFKDAALIHLTTALKDHFRIWLPQDLLELSIVHPQHNVFSNRIFQTTTWKEWALLGKEQLGQSSSHLAIALTEQNVPENIAKGISLSMEKFGNELKGEIKGLQHSIGAIKTAITQSRPTPSLPNHAPYYMMPYLSQLPLHDNGPSTPPSTHIQPIDPSPFHQIGVPPAPTVRMSSEDVARSEAISKFGDKYYKTQFKWDGTALIPQYCFAQNVKTVFEIVTEWRRGIDGSFSIEELNNTWSAAWRRNRDSVKTEYRRRKAIVDAVLSIQMENKKSEAVAIQMLEARFPEHTQNVSTMARKILKPIKIT